MNPVLKISLLILSCISTSLIEATSSTEGCKNKQLLLATEFCSGFLHGRFYEFCIPRQSEQGQIGAAGGLGQQPQPPVVVPPVPPVPNVAPQAPAVAVTITNGPSFAVIPNRILLPLLTKLSAQYPQLAKEAAMCTVDALFRRIHCRDWKLYKGEAAFAHGAGQFTAQILKAYERGEKMSGDTVIATLNAHLVVGAWNMLSEAINSK